MRKVITGTAPYKGIGRPDYSAPAPVGSFAKPTVYAGSDVYELAARLGSPDVFDRRGDIVWMDDFEHGLNKWYSVTTGVGGNIGTTTTVASRGDCSLQMKAGDAIGSYARIARAFPLPKLGRIGAEYSFAINSSIITVAIWTYIAVGTLQYLPYVYLLQSAGSFSLYYRNDAGVSTPLFEGQTIPIASLYGTRSIFHVLKIVVDVSTGYWTRIIFDNVEYDVHLQAMDFTPGWASAPIMELVLDTTRGAAGDGITSLDNVLVTQNEPVQI